MLNKLLLYGFRQKLFEIKDKLGESIEAEMWDKGWTKINEVYPPAKDYTADYQHDVGSRPAEFINCVPPIYVELRPSDQKLYR